MAGIFGFFDFTKPGKGVDKDAPVKHRFFVFFELIWRKFSRLILLNLMYFLVCLPIIVAIYFVFYSMLAETGAFSMVEYAEQGVSLFSILMTITAEMSASIPFLPPVLLVISLLLLGPMTCGLTYMLRNFAREEHAWMSDFFERSKQNIKQGLALAGIDLLAVLLIALNLLVVPYMMQDQPVTSSSWVFTAARLLSMTLAFFYMFMRNYTYLIAVTFDMPLGNILKNSAIFAVVGLWRNLLILVVMAACIVLMIIFPVVELFLLPLCMLSFWGFLSVFTVYPLVEKHMIAPLLPKAEEAEEGEGSAESPDPDME